MNTLVFDGGGSFGVAYIGVIKALEKSDKLKMFNTFIGCSVGSIFALLILLGYDAAGIQQIIFDLDFNKMYSLSRINIVKKGHYGDIKYIMKIIQTAISLKYPHTITFKELYDITKKKLIINTVCICDNKPVYFDYENSPDLQVMYAIRMSISLPYIYPFVEYKNKFYIDGGICQLPIHLYDVNTHLVFIFDILKDNKEANKKDPFYFVKQLAQTIGRFDYIGHSNIIKIPIQGLHSLSNPTQQQKLDMVKSGFMVTIDYLKNNFGK